MTRIVFNEEQNEMISNITGSLICDPQYRQNTIYTYYNNPQYLSIFVIYALEQLLKRCESFASKDICQKLEQYAGENQSGKIYNDYDTFMNNWKQDYLFRKIMINRFENNNIGYLKPAELVAYGVIKSTAENQKIGLNQVGTRR